MEYCIFSYLACQCGSLKNTFNYILLKEELSPGTPDTTEETTTEKEESSVTDEEPDYTLPIIGIGVLIAVSILGAAVILRR